MPRDSEFSSYVFIKNDLAELGWDTKNPARNPSGQLYTQQECLDHQEFKKTLIRQRPEYVVKIYEDTFWVIEAKGSISELDKAFNEAKGYADCINKSKLIRVRPKSL
jgi:hypothetical protein